MSEDEREQMEREWRAVLEQRRQVERELEELNDMLEDFHANFLAEESDDEATA